MHKKILAVGSLATLAAPVFAAGENPLSAVETAMTGYITTAQTSIVTVLTAGAVIVGCFFLWKILKRALNSSK